MDFKFEWNEFADQPHNVAPRKERLRRHLRHFGSYFRLIGSNLRVAVPVLRTYRRYWKAVYRSAVSIGPSAFGVACSPVAGRFEEVVRSLRETGVRTTLVRIPSWERAKLDYYQDFVGLLHDEGFKIVLALLQNREDVLRPSSWHDFCGEVFARFSPLAEYFEVGHAWNRTKWGVWDYEEYLSLAAGAASAAGNYDLKLVGPAVIDFEFHLYPPTLRAIPFDIISSLLYVDRVRSPENAQFGWTTAQKTALLRAVVDSTSRRGRELWITEVNWPLEGTGKYSPAPGKPGVSEEEQASFLVRYFVICLAAGFVRRVYWWQLAAPGYGLIDNRGETWRQRPAYPGLAVMVGMLDGSCFVGKIPHPSAEIFLFRRAEETFAVCWTKKGRSEYRFPAVVRKIVGRDGKKKDFPSGKIVIGESPQYVFFSECPIPEA